MITNLLDPKRIAFLLAILGALTLAMPSWADDDEDEEEDEIELTEAQVFAFLEKHVPQAIEELASIEEEEGEEAYEEAYEYAEETIVYYLELKEVDPAAAKALIALHNVEYQVHALAEAVHEIEDDADREDAVGALRKALEEQFDLETELEEAELKLLKQEVVQIEQLLAERKDQRKEIIENDIEDLLEDDAEEDEEEE